MPNKNSKGFTLVELMIVITVILILMTLFLTLRGPIMKQLANLGCKANLKEYEKALQLYRNDFEQKYPPYSGVKFIAILYQAQTGYLMNKKYFLCPARDDSEWNESQDTAQRTDCKFRRPATGDPYPQPGEWDPAELFRSWEINYAGRRNDPMDENGKFRLTGETVEPTPIVSDTTLDHQGNNAVQNAPHDGYVNVLMTDGSITSLRGVMVGASNREVPMDLECLTNDNDN